MIKTTLAALKQAIAGKGFLLGVAGVVLVLFLSGAESIIEAFRSEGSLQNGFHGRLILTALSSDGMSLALPILCALPFTTSFVDDMKSGFIKEYLPRTTIRRYISGKLFACAVSGGSVVPLGALIAAGMAALVFSPMEAAPVKGAVAPEYLAGLMSRLAPVFFCGAFLSVVGMTLAALTNSRYMAYASPFVFYYVLIILCERYFDALYVFYPKEWLDPSDLWKLGNAGAALLLLGLTVVAALCFGAAAKRRLAQI